MIDELVKNEILLYVHILQMFVMNTSVIISEVDSGGGNDACHWEMSEYFMLLGVCSSFAPVPLLLHI